MQNSVVSSTPNGREITGFQIEDKTSVDKPQNSMQIFNRRHLTEMLRLGFPGCIGLLALDFARTLFVVMMNPR